MIMVENSAPNNSINFVLNMGFNDNIPLPTLHNRMELLRGETVLSHRWVGVCCRTGLFHTIFGSRQCSHSYTY